MRLAEVQMLEQMLKDCDVALKNAEKAIYENYARMDSTNCFIASDKLGRVQNDLKLVIMQLEMVENFAKGA